MDSDSSTPALFPPPPPDSSYPLTNSVNASLASQVRSLLTPITRTPFGAPIAPLFSFPPTWTNLNHGAYGATPTAISAYSSALRLESERRPDNFMYNIRPTILTRNRLLLAEYLNAPPSTIVQVPNATTGVNTVVRALKYDEGDVIVTFDFAYGGCAKTLEYICKSTPARLVVIECPVPASSDAIVCALQAGIEQEQKKGERVVLAVFETVTSTYADCS